MLRKCITSLFCAYVRICHVSGKPATKRLHKLPAKYTTHTKQHYSSSDLLNEIMNEAEHAMWQHSFGKVGKKYGFSNQAWRVPLNFHARLVCRITLATSTKFNRCGGGRKAEVWSTVESPSVDPSQARSRE